MSEDERQSMPAAEQTVARLFEAAGHEVSQTVGREPGTVDWFVMLRAGIVRGKTYFRAWPRCPESLDAALASLEEARRVSKAERALAVVMEGALPAGYAADLQGRVTNAISYRRLSLEVSGIAEEVRAAAMDYERAGGPRLYLPYRARAASGETVDAVSHIKHWVQSRPAGDLVLRGSGHLEHSSIAEQVVYELAVQCRSDPEHCKPLVRDVGGAAAEIAMDEGFAVLIHDDEHGARPKLDCSFLKSLGQIMTA